MYRTSVVIRTVDEFMPGEYTSFVNVDFFGAEHTLKCLVGQVQCPVLDTP